MNARVVAAPKGTKRILRGLRPPTCFAWAARRRGRLMHQLHVTIRTAGKPLSILRFTLGTIHGAPGLSSPKVTLFSTLAKGTFQKRLTFPRFSFDFPVICGTLSSVENCIWGAGACSRFFFSDRQFGPLPTQNNQNRVL